MSILLWVLTVLLLLPVCVIAFECFSTLLPAYNKRKYSCDRPRLAVLIPAHNEVAVISDTLASITPQLKEGDRLVVVADNCTDKTAQVAASVGADVVERHDEKKRGKGFALAYGLDAFRHDPPEVLIMVDADCIVKDGAIDTLARSAMGMDRPAQALYLMQAGQQQPPLKIKVAEFAWTLKNHVRPLGLSCFGLPCQLMGTGMAFPWHIIEAAELASDAIVEDMQMGLELALQGHPTVFCPEACVTSCFPSFEQDIGTQRKRWEHGHISMILKYCPKLLMTGLRKRDGSLLTLGLDLMVLPLALLSMLLIVGLVITSIAIPFGFLAPFAVLFSGCLVLFISLLLAWYYFARDVIGIKEVLAIPVYIFSKISLYTSFIYSRESKWIKTGREHDDV
ncbi:MAG: glycosyltransferase [Mariprofundaceae bacterium]